ncbi:hypothetical protein GCM10010106_48790 [Thermopolyspora flexuosa]|uniref:Uncharacterized protein n=1 Tax=Thermopolyspora flexuosa TaxID=103836 RepID=A0A543J2H6_9ACTN|nr:hypothetical protein FHX40_3781 [Thermopolyspora flexuosa]GGM94435.1 hypothetical protein GCM10010106_48790 [Thermopolyspora flexuosa]
MLKKLVVASATVAAAAGLGLATPAYANGPADVACVLTNTGNTHHHTANGLGILGALGLYDLLSNRNVDVNCDVDKQINNNHHVDSHKTGR